MDRNHILISDGFWLTLLCKWENIIFERRSTAMQTLKKIVQEIVQKLECPKTCTHKRSNDRDNPKIVKMVFYKFLRPFFSGLSISETLILKLLITLTWPIIRIPWICFTIIQTSVFMISWIFVNQFSLPSGVWKILIPLLWKWDLQVFTLINTNHSFLRSHN